MTDQATPTTPAIGIRVRVLGFATRPVPPGGSKDLVTGLIRDAAGNVTTIDDNVTVPPGTEGTVSFIDDSGQIKVDWDNGSCLGLLPEDEWETA